MSKIIVPQELREQIVDLYVNKGKTRKDIKRDLELPFSDSVIKRVLQEEGAEIRTNPGAQKGGRKKQEVSRELQDQIIAEYAKGHGLERIVRDLNLPFSFDKVRSILQDNNVHIRDVKESNAITTATTDYRKYKVNDNYNLLSHNGAWLLGFIAADGYLPTPKGGRNRITISLARKDQEVLELIAKEIEYEGEIFQYESNGYPSSSLSFASKTLRAGIESYGIGNNKTFKLKHLPPLPKEYMIDFIRGYFDGDGSITEPNDSHKIRTSITGANASFLEEIVDFMHENYGLRKVKLHSVERVHTIYDFQYSTNDSFKFCHLMYDNDYLALPRKKRHYFQILDKYSLRNDSHEPKPPKG